MLPPSFTACLRKTASVGICQYLCAVTCTIPSPPTNICHLQIYSMGSSKMYSHKVSHAPLISRLLSVCSTMCYFFLSLPFIFCFLHYRKLKICCQVFFNDFLFYSNSSYTRTLPLSHALPPSPSGAESSILPIVHFPRWNSPCTATVPEAPAAGHPSLP